MKTEYPTKLHVAIFTTNVKPPKSRKHKKVSGVAWVLTHSPETPPLEVFLKKGNYALFNRILTPEEELDTVKKIGESLNTKPEKINFHPPPDSPA